MKKLRILACSLALALTCGLLPALAVAPEVIKGEWQGEIAVPGSPLAITVALSQDAQGKWHGTVDIPAQKAFKLLLEAITVKDDAVGFTIAGIPGKPTFSGKLDAKGELKGSFTQSGQEMTFKLHKPTPTTVPVGDPLKTLEPLFERELKNWQVPGMAIAIVQNGQVIFSKGFGVRDLDQKQPVTPDTLFAIGSTTKAFTALLLGQLVEEGKLEWNKPLKHYLPDFVLKDPMATNLMTARDLLNHISGLPRHDLMWYGSAFTRQELYERLRYLEPSASFRETFQYQNLMFMTAGLLAEKITGQKWEELVQQRILTPLGMTQSNFSVAAMQQSPSFAWPYKRQQQQVQKMAFRNINAIGPAGSINASITDMAKWVQFHLGAGEIKGKKLISLSGLRALHTPQVVASGLGSFPEIPYSLYSNGWVITPYRGRTVVEHGGNIDGFSAQVGLIPDLNVGVVILTNQNASVVPQVLAYAVYDAFMQLPPVDWSTRFKSKIEALEKSPKTANQAEELRAKGTKPTHLLADYAGQYSHPGYGTVKITLPKDDLALSFNEQEGKLEHWHYDVFRLQAKDGNPFTVLMQFHYNNEGDIDSLTIPMEMATDPILFKRLPDPQLTSVPFLKTLTGTYQLTEPAVVPVTVSLVGETLQIEVKGQPAYVLVPKPGKNTFKFRDLPGFQIRFVVEGNQVKRLLFLQPNGIFAAIKKP